MNACDEGFLEIVIILLRFSRSLFCLPYFTFGFVDFRFAASVASLCFGAYVNDLRF